jgi:tetratricopeptide (TPR) repeat protein
MTKLTESSGRVTAGVKRSVARIRPLINRVHLIVDQRRWLAVACFMLLPLPLVIWIHAAHAGGFAEPVDLGTDYLKATGILMLLSGFVIAEYWLLKKQSGYSMLPFLNATGDEFNGQAVSEELAAELQRIRRTYQSLDQLKQEFEGTDDEDRDSNQENSSSSSRLAPNVKSKGPPPKSPTAELSTLQNLTQAGPGEIASFKYGDNSISLGKFFSDLKTFWRQTDPKGIFSGSIRRYGHLVRIVVSFHGRLQGNQIQELCWSASRKIASAEDRAQIADLIKELAFQIYHEIEQDGRPKCKTWIALTHHTDVISHWTNYLITRKSDALEAATKSCEGIIAAEPEGQSALPVLKRLAREHLDRGQYDTAALMYSSVVELQSVPGGEKEKIADAWILYGVADHLSGRHLSAERSYRLALSEYPQFEAGWWNLASLLIQLGREKDAVVAVRRVADCRKLTSDVDLGDLFMEFRLIEEAEAYYRSAVHRNPQDVRALISLGSLLCDAKRNDEAISVYNAALDLEPKRAGTHNELGIVYAASGRPDDAIKHYLEAIALESDDAAPHVNLGRLYLNQNRPEDARTEFLIAIATQPRMSSAYSSLGLALVNMKRYEEAEEALQLGLRLGEDQPEVHEALGSVYSSKGENEKAVGAFKKAAELAPEWSNPRIMLGYLYRDMKRYEEAEEALQLGLRLGGDQPEVHEALGSVYSSKGENEKAVGEFKKAAELAPELSNPHTMLGYLYRDSDVLDVALQEFRIAQAKDPNKPDAYHGAGAVLRRLDRFSDAVQEYKSAIEINGRDAYAHIALAACYERAGQAELSAKHRIIALELGDNQVEGEYNRACFWALAGDRKRSLQFLSEAISSSRNVQAMAMKDVDLYSLRGDTEFEAPVTRECESKAEESPTVANGKTS